MNGNYRINDISIVLWVFSLLVLNTHSIGLAQTLDSVEGILRHARQLKEVNPDVSLRLSKSALQIGFDRGDRQIQAQAQLIIGSISLAQEQYLQAQRSFSGVLNHAHALNQPYLLFQAKHALARIHHIINKKNTSIRYYLHAIKLAETHSYENVLTLYQELSAVFQEQKEFSQSLIYDHKALTILEKTQRTNDLISTYQQMSKKYYEQNKIENSIRYDEKAYRLIKTRTNPNISSSTEANIFELISKKETLIHRYDKALHYAKRSLDIQTDLQNINKTGEILEHIVSIYISLNNYKEALFYAFEHLAIQEQQQNINAIAAAYNTIGDIYVNLARNNKAKQYYTRTHQISHKALDITYKTNAFLALAKIYYEENHFHKALYYANQSLITLKSSKKTEKSTSINQIMGQIHQSLGNSSKALTFFLLSLEQARQMQSAWDEANILIKIGHLHSDSQPSDSLNYAKQGLVISKRISAKYLMAEAYRILSIASENLEDFESAYKYTSIQNHLTREINHDEVTKRVSELRTIQETEKYEREIEHLKREAQIKELELHSASTELEILNSENIISTLQLEREGNTRVILIGLTLVVLFVLALLFSRYRYSRQRQEILKDKNIEIEFKNTKLEETNQTKDRFFSIIAHDLRAPVSFVVSLSNLLSSNFDEYETSSLKTYVSDIHKSSTQTYELLDELLEWAMQQLRNTEPSPRQHCAKQVCESATKAIDSIIREKNILIKNTIENKQFIYADKNMINTVIRNLVINALKYSPRDASIEISCESNEQYTTIHIKDYGIGIANQYLANLFSIDKKKSPTGEQVASFGLALCKDLINKNGGDIFVSSKQNEGSDFYFRLPKNKTRVA